MASIQRLREVRYYLINFNSLKNNFIRTFSLSASKFKEEGWLSKLLHVRKIEPTTDSHSKLLTDKDAIFELQTHNVKPDQKEDYLKHYEEYCQMVKNNSNLPINLIGSWTVEVGDEDQVLHLWKYSQGYSAVSKVRNVFNSNQEFQSHFKKRLTYLRSRQVQLLMSFSFWGDPQPRPPKNIYEVRSYVLKPGTMIEWGNNWARGITFRKEQNESVAGLFSQIGVLYNVHHFWAYKDYQMRKETRESTWRKPGWDECVAYTVPLIRKMESRILIPTSFSPLQ